MEGTPDRVNEPGVDRFGDPLAPKVERFRAQFKDAKPPEEIETAEDLLAMFFHKVAQSESHTKTFLKNGF